jgi:hypothetical protein
METLPAGFGAADASSRGIARQALSESFDVSRLTDRQCDAIAAIVSLTKEGNRPPTIREIAERMGIKSPNGAMCHILPLLKKGAVLRRVALTSRGIAVVGRCPCCGK